MLGSDTGPHSLSSDWYQLLFGIRRSVRYHRRRSRFFDKWGKWTNALNIILGSTAVASTIALSGSASRCGRIVRFAGAIVAIVSTIDILISSSVAARNHSDLARRFVELEREMSTVNQQTMERLVDLKGKRLAIEADEPDIMRILDVMCHNDLVLADGGPSQQIYEISWFKRRLSQFVNFDTHNLVISTRPTIR